MEEYGIRISLPGISAVDGPVKDMILDSRYPLLKIQAAGSGSLTWTDSSTTDSDTYAHNLGYIPRVLVFGQRYEPASDTEITAYTRYPYVSGSALVRELFSVEVDSTTLTVSAETTGGDGSSHTVNYYYFVYYDEE